jgi:hypothetical protein
MKKNAVSFFLFFLNFFAANGQNQSNTNYNGFGGLYGASILLIESDVGMIKVKQASPIEIIGAYYNMAWAKNNQFKKVNFLLTKRTFRNNITNQTGVFDNFNDNYLLSAEFCYGVNLIGVFHVGVLGGTAFKLANTVSPTKETGYRYEIVQALKKSFTKAEIYSGVQMSLEYKLISIVGSFTKNLTNIYGKGTLNGLSFSINSKPYFYTVGVGVKF